MVGLLHRALYSKRDIVLLDDVLCSVDAHVANSIFAHLADRKIRKKRTIIFATNNREFCRKVDRIVVLDKGAVIGSPPFYNWLECLMVIKSC